MKRLLYAGLLLCAACTGPETFRAGTYVKHAESEYSIADDTLTITDDKQVIRHVAYTKKSDGSRHHLVQNERASWDKDVLIIDRTGAKLRFTAAGLQLGNSLYTRL